MQVWRVLGLDWLPQCRLQLGLQGRDDVDEARCRSPQHAIHLEAFLVQLVGVLNHADDLFPQGRLDPWVAHVESPLDDARRKARNPRLVRSRAVRLLVSGLVHVDWLVQLGQELYEQLLQSGPDRVSRVRVGGLRALGLLGTGLPLGKHEPAHHTLKGLAVRTGPSVQTVVSYAVGSIELAGKVVLEQVEELLVHVALPDAWVELVQVEEELEKVDGLHEDDDVETVVGHGVARLSECGGDFLVDAPLDLQGPVRRKARYSRPSVRHGITPHLKTAGRERKQAGGPRCWHEGRCNVGA
jgi:hypothetical protein